MRIPNKELESRTANDVFPPVFRNGRIYGRDSGTTGCATDFAGFWPERLATEDWNIWPKVPSTKHQACPKCRSVAVVFLSRLSHSVRFIFALPIGAADSRRCGEGVWMGVGRGQGKGGGRKGIHIVWPWMSECLLISGRWENYHEEQSGRESKARKRALVTVEVGILTRAVARNY